ncbi:MAG: DMT family transporter [Candidatus Magnetominusculus sp. LBB02]|nr:DMT family transporter [Candidatus Magnetominusculus sp. LBB02]
MGKSYIQIILALLIWSSQGIAVRAAKTPVVSIVFYSLIVSLAIQSFIFISPSIRKGIPSSRGLFGIFFLSLLTLINTLTYLYAYTYTSISNAVFTHYIAPIVVMLLSPIFLKERITKAAVFAVLTASCGLWIIVRDVSVMEIAAGFFSLSNPAGTRFSHDTIGILCGLASGAAYGGMIIVLKMISITNNKYVAVFFQNLFVAVLLLPFAGPMPQEAVSLCIIAGMGLIYSTVATYLYFSGMTHAAANKAAILGYIEPIGAITFGAVILSEYPDMLSLAGGALIITAGYIAIKKG